MGWIFETVRAIIQHKIIGNQWILWWLIKTIKSYLSCLVSGQSLSPRQRCFLIERFSFFFLPQHQRRTIIVKHKEASRNYDWALENRQIKISRRTIQIGGEFLLTLKGIEQITFIINGFLLSIVFLSFVYFFFYL